MAGSFEFAEVNYTLADIYVCRFNFVSGAYEGAVGTIAAPQNFEGDYDHDTDKLMASGRNLRGLSIKKGAKVKLKMGGVDFSAKAIMTGATNRTSDNPPNRVRQSDVPAGGGGLPYFGAICTGPTDDGGLWTAGFVALKLEKEPGFKLDGETNKFNMAEVNADGFAVDILDDGVLYVDRWLGYETASDFTAPTDAAAFLAYFDDIS